MTFQHLSAVAAHIDNISDLVFSLKYNRQTGDDVRDQILGAEGYRKRAQPKGRKKRTWFEPEIEEGKVDEEDDSDIARQTDEKAAYSFASGSERSADQAEQGLYNDDCEDNFREQDQDACEGKQVDALRPVPLQDKSDQGGVASGPGGKKSYSDQNDEETSHSLQCHACHVKRSAYAVYLHTWPPSF